MNWVECLVTPGTQTSTFFFPSSFSLSVSLSVSVDSCPDFLQFQGPFCGVGSRCKTNRQRQCRQNHQDLGLAVWRLPVDAASTGNLQIASPKSWWFCHDCCWQFSFHRGSTPLNGPWNCEKSSHKWSEPERKKWKKIQFRVPGHWALANVHFWNLWHLYHFRAYVINKKLPFRVVILTGIQINKRKMFFCYFPVVFIKKTHMY